MADPTKLTLVYDNLITDSSMITASSEATNYGKANLIDKAYQTCWRSTGVTSESLLIDLGSAKSIKAFILGNHNLFAEVTTLNLKYGTTDACADGTVDISDDLTENDFIHFLDSLSYRYWKLEIAGSTNITFYSIGELWLSTYVELDKNPLANVSPYDKEHVAHEEGLHAYNLYSYIDWPLEWGNYNNSVNHDKLLALWNTVKKARPFWIMLDPSEDSTLKYVVIREFSFNQFLGVGYPGRMRVVNSL